MRCDQATADDEGSSTSCIAKRCATTSRSPGAGTRPGSARAFRDQLLAAAQCGDRCAPQAVPPTSARISLTRHWRSIFLRDIELAAGERRARHRQRDPRRGDRAGGRQRAARRAQRHWPAIRHVTCMRGWDFASFETTARDSGCAPSALAYRRQNLCLARRRSPSPPPDRASARSDTDAIPQGCRSLRAPGATRAPFEAHDRIERAVRHENRNIAVGGGRFGRQLVAAEPDRWTAPGCRRAARRVAGRRTARSLRPARSPRGRSGADGMPRAFSRAISASISALRLAHAGDVGAVVQVWGGDVVPGAHAHAVVDRYRAHRCVRKYKTHGMPLAASRAPVR